MKFLKTKTVIHINEAVIRETGGGSFHLRDLNGLKSALDRPKNIWHYESPCTFSKMAASLVYGLIKNHPFANGNKRTALITLDVFCDINGKKLIIDQATAVWFMEAIASDEVGLEEIEDRLKALYIV